MDDSSVDERHEIFIHIKELPWLAYRHDIKELFHGLSVKEDGILIRNYNAFVAFHNPLDIYIAMKQENRLLLGSKVKLSVINRDELRRFLVRSVKRKLDFTEEDGGVSKKCKAKTEMTHKKKIRPTPVTKSKKRKVEYSLTFCPKESELPPPSYDKDIRLLSWAPHDKELLPNKKKKIHPFKLSDAIDAENFSTFHPELCFDVQNMVLAVS